MSDTDVRTHPAYAALAEKTRQQFAPGEAARVLAFTMEAAQGLFLEAWRIAQASDQSVAGTPALVSVIIDAAWALAAAHAEDRVVLGETAGILIGVEERLTQSCEGIRQVFYPEWRRLLAEQGAARRT